MRGVAFLTAVTFAAEIGDVRRFGWLTSAWCPRNADRGAGPTRQHHQGWQPEGPPCPDRGCLELIAIRLA